MFAQPTALLALLFIAVRCVIATPPACLIAAVNKQPDPSLLKQVCSGDNATAVEQYICGNCSSNEQIAIIDFASVCSGVGVTIHNSSSCSAGSAGQTSSGTSSLSPATSTTGIANSSGSPTASSSGASASSSSTAATTRLEMDMVGMLALGVFGAVLVT